MVKVINGLDDEEWFVAKSLRDGRKIGTVERWSKSIIGTSARRHNFQKASQIFNLARTILSRNLENKAEERMFAYSSNLKRIKSDLEVLFSTNFVELFHKGDRWRSDRWNAVFFNFRVRRGLKCTNKRIRFIFAKIPVDLFRDQLLDYKILVALVVEKSNSKVYIILLSSHVSYIP